MKCAAYLADGRPCPNPGYLGRDLCFAHQAQARKDRSRTPNYAGAPRKAQEALSGQASPTTPAPAPAWPYDEQDAQGRVLRDLYGPFVAESYHAWDPMCACPACAEREIGVEWADEVDL